MTGATPQAGSEAVRNDGWLGGREEAVGVGGKGGIKEESRRQNRLTLEFGLECGWSDPVNREAVS